MSEERVQVNQSTGIRNAISLWCGSRVETLGFKSPQIKDLRFLEVTSNAMLRRSKNE